MSEGKTQQLTLYGSVPLSRHNQILSVLAGLTAISTPRKILEYHYILKPSARPNPKPVQQVGGTQDVDSGKLIRQAAENGENYVYSDLVEDAILRESIDQPFAFEQDIEDRWTLHSAETPDAGPNSRRVVSRHRTITKLSSKNVATFAESNGLVVVNQYIMDGHEFVHKNILVRLARCLLVSNAKGVISVGSDLSKLDAALLDSSGSWILEASILVEDQASTDRINQGRDELERLKHELEGSLELGVVSRQALDTKVK